MARPSRLDYYEIDENEFGEFLLATPDLGGEVGSETGSVHFRIEGDDILLIFENGEVVRLIDVPDGLCKRIDMLDQIAVAEIEDGYEVRSYYSRKLAA